MSLLVKKTQYYLFKVTLCLFLIAMSFNVNAQKSDNPIELGTVDWMRSYQEALSRAVIEKKPVLILFQEVPGCVNCTRFGREVLSHPIIVDAIETLFVPLAIYNNNKGEDERILEKFDEPSWNNPVVRIINYDEKEIAPRLNNDFTPSGLTESMLYALRNINKETPPYLELLYDQLIADHASLEQATFSMYCFWKGEAVLGNIDGVLHTKAGFINESEVVQLSYDPTVISFHDLCLQAKQQNCSDIVFYNNEEQKEIAKSIFPGDDQKIYPAVEINADKQPKYYLFESSLSQIPMFSIQAMKVNSMLRSENLEMSAYLSPQQIRLFDFIKEHPQVQWTNVTDQDFLASWAEVLLRAESQGFTR